MTRHAIPRRINPPADPQPVQMRLIGEDHAVHALVDALHRAATCGPVSYRPTRYGGSTRAYLTILIPTPDHTDGEQ